MDAGDTFLVDRPNTSYDSHLWIVISDPAVDADRVVIVNLTSHRADKDQACVLEVGDHPYVAHRTCVNYNGAKVVRDADIAFLLRTGKTRACAACSAALLQRIRDGIPESRMTLGIVEVLVEQGVIDDP